MYNVSNSHSYNSIWRIMRKSGDIFVIRYAFYIYYFYTWAITNLLAKVRDKCADHISQTDIQQNRFFYTPFSSSFVRRFSNVLTVPVKMKDRKDEIEKKHVWMINVGPLIIERRLILPTGK